MNMNKKTYIILTIVIVLILAGFAFYKYSIDNRNLQNENNPENNESQQDVNQNNNQVEIKEIEVEGSNNLNGSINGGDQGGLVVCVYKCGDGVCQKKDNTCDPNGLSCICEENIQECPEDCSN